MGRMTKIILLSVVGGLLLIFFIVLAINGFSMSRLLGNTSGQQGTGTELSGAIDGDFNELVDEFLANEMNQLSGDQQGSGVNRATGTQDISSSGTLGSVDEFTTEDIVADNNPNDKETLYKLRLEQYQQWRLQEFGEEGQGTGDQSLTGTHESATLDESDQKYLEIIDNNTESAQEAQQKAYEENMGLNDLPDAEFEGPIGRIEE